MSQKLVDCKEIQGEVKLPLSKSYVQRFLIGTFLADELEEAIVSLKAVARAASLDDFSDDIQIMVKALLELGRDADEVDVECGDSGATARMLLPVAAILDKKANFHRNPGLRKRPMCEFAYELRRHMEDGKLQPGVFHIPGNISSQFVSGLLFALPCLDGDSRIEIDGELQSAPYVEMTIHAMKLFGVEVERKGNDFAIPGGQHYVYSSDCLSLLERDWSAAAMWLAADYLLGGGLELVGTNSDSLQGDRIIVEIIDELKKSEDRFSKESANGQSQEPLELDVSNCPDIAPCIALAAVKSNCEVKLVNAARLRLKECDRLAAIVRILGALGAKLEEGEDFILVHGMDIRDGELLAGTDAPIDCENDHRMVMMAALASIITERPIVIDNVEAVNKSYPGFFEWITNLER